MEYDTESDDEIDIVHPRYWWNVDDDISIYTIHGFGEEGSDRYSVTLSFRGKLIHVSIFRPSARESNDSQGLKEEKQVDAHEAHVFELFYEALYDENDVDFTQRDDRLIYFLLEAGRPILEQLPVEEMADKQCLHSQLFRETLTYRLAGGSDGKPSFAPISAEESHNAPEADADTHEGADMRGTIVDTIPQHSSREIRLSTFYTQGSRAVEDNVYVNGQEMHLKADGGPLRPDSGLGREIRALSMIRRAFKQGDEGISIRVPLLLGYVNHFETGRILGIVMTLVGGRILQWISIKETAIETRRKWASQIRGMVRRLHAAGVVWGSAEPSNLVVDKNDDVWLFDFRGGCSQRWMDLELHNTMEGDDQAVERIIEFLEIGENAKPPSAAVSALRQIRDAYII